jgi:hypothetical protein
MPIYNTVTNKIHNVAIHNFTIKTLKLQHVSIYYEASSGRSYRDGCPEEIL